MAKTERMTDDEVWEIFTLVVESIVIVAVVYGTMLLIMWGVGW